MASICNRPLWSATAPTPTIPSQGTPAIKVSNPTSKRPESREQVAAELRWEREWTSDPADLNSILMLCRCLHRRPAAEQKERPIPSTPLRLMLLQGQQATRSSPSADAPCWASWLLLVVVGDRFHHTLTRVVLLTPTSVSFTNARSGTAAKMDSARLEYGSVWYFFNKHEVFPQPGGLQRPVRSLRVTHQQ